MATHRRIVRSSTTTPESSITQESYFRIFLGHSTRMFRFFWKILTVIWYWFERLFLIVFLILLVCGLAWWLSQKPSLYRDWDSADMKVPEVSWT